MILDALLKNGARLARAGEFSQRAVINQKMDFTKAEAISALIESKSEDSVKILAKQLKGDLSNYVNEIRESLIEILAHIEVLIDYAEEDLDPNLLNTILDKVDSAIKVLSHTLNISKRREGLLKGYKIAIIGKPNVGKSSLLNSLLSYNRAIISQIAGTTRDTIEEEIRIGTHIVKIVDTAGIRDANDEIERVGIERSKLAVDESEVVLALFDGSRDFDSDDEAILEIISSIKDEKKVFILLTKSDLPQVIDLEKIKNLHYTNISKDDTDKVIDLIKEYLDTNLGDDELILINKRQVNETQKAHDSLRRSKELLKEGELELFAYEINESIQAISSITNPFERDEILDHMFSSFCLGK